jgi:hypothetical protein
MSVEPVTRRAPSHWRPLSRCQARRLDRLANRNVRLLSVAELLDLDNLVHWAQHCGDDGDWLWDDEGVQDSSLVQPDLTAEQFQYLYGIELGIRDELSRRQREGREVWSEPKDDRIASQRMPTGPVRRAHRVEARPRERRARPARRARSPGRSDDDPHEPAPALAGSRTERRLA